MKALIFLLLISFQSSLTYSQSFGEYISSNVLKVNEDGSLDSNLYEKFQDFSLIMIGEMHGTNEPADLVKNLAKLILIKEESISIGLEIPENEMETYIEFPSDSTLLKTKFFSKQNIDGRNGKAWFDLIRFCSSQPNINLFFFDNYQAMNIRDRDSSMYLSIKKQKSELSNPLGLESKVITLSGNIHNWLIPFNNKPTMGTYCSIDTSLFNTGSICSINHLYSGGTMLNNIGSGLELRTIPFEESVYTRSTEFKKYLLFNQASKSKQYNCTYFTRYVSYSEELKMDN